MTDINPAGRPVETVVTTQEAAIGSDRRRLSVLSHFILTICLPLLGVLVAAIYTWREGAGAAELVNCAIMFVLTFIGVEVGFHRHFAHRSFKTVRSVRVVLTALGSMAVQGSVLWWAGVHRVHHRHADAHEDPHSPLDGFVHAHVGWLFRNLDPPGWRLRARDLFRDDVTRSATRAYYGWVIAGFVLPGIFVALGTRSWDGLFRGLVWGGLVRLFLVNQVIWSINSICHTFGSRPYPTRDGSRNNALLSIPSLGFSWHNNHHAFPRAAITSHHWWQPDACGLVILFLKWTGLAWDVRLAARSRRADLQKESERPPEPRRRRVSMAS